MRIFKRPRQVDSSSVAGGLFTFDEVCAEWELSDLDPLIDLDRWKVGIEEYEAVPATDVDGNRRAGLAIAQGLRHHLVHDDLLPVPQQGCRRNMWLLHSTRCVGMAATLGRSVATFNHVDEKLVRLAMTIAGRYGYQPTMFGGDDSLDPLFDDKEFFLLMAVCISHDDVIADPDRFLRSIPAGAVVAGSGRPLPY